MKAKAMETVLEEFYPENKPWLNVIGIGDSEIERIALREKFAGEVTKHGPRYEGRCKTVKLQKGPELPQLTQELLFLESWLHPIVRYDGNYDVDFEENEA